MIKYTLKHWSCVCGYYQDFEPTPEAMFKSFSRFDDTCPSCKQNKLKESVSPRVYMRTIDKTNPDDLKEEKKDADGKPVMVNETTAEMKTLTKAEQNAKIAKSEADVSVLANQIVKEEVDTK
jgi:hypothetical protein